VDAIFVGKDRLNNRRFLQMCSYYLVEPVACTPAWDWEKGQFGNQVGLIRERFFTSRLRFKSFDELNACLIDKFIAYATAHKHPAFMDKMAWEVLEADRPRLVRYVGWFDGFHAVPRGLQDLPGALRQQQVLGGGQGGRAAGRDPSLLPIVS
jgi:hypothetical protein